MIKKLKNLQNEAKIAQEKAEEATKLVELAQQELLDKIDNTKKEIEKLAESEDLFCGIILGHDDLIAVLQLALKTGENVKIPFSLYPKDTVEENKIINT